MKWICFFQFLAIVISSNSLEVEVWPKGVIKVPEDTISTLTLSLTLNSSDPLDQALSSSNALLAIRVIPEEDWKLDFVNNTVEFNAGEIAAGLNKTIAFSGYYWGYSKLSFYLAVNHVDEVFLPGTLVKDDVIIVVDRGQKLLDIVFMATVTLFILCNNVNMGCQLDIQVILEVIKRPLGPLCGFISQFAFMPGFSYLIGWIFFTDPLHRLGLFTLGCCPGGAMSNFWTLMFNGDLNLSVTMTFVSTIAAMGMMPLWMYTLGSSLLKENKHMKIPFSNLAISLISLTVPVCIGMYIKYKRPHFAKVSDRLIKPFTLCIIIFIVTVGTYNMYKAFLTITGEMWLAGCLVAMSGYSFGAIFAKCWCLSKDKIIAISIETALQNAGVALVLLKLSLPSPDSDLAAVPAFAQLFMTGPPIMTLFIVYSLVKKFCDCCPNAPDDNSLDNCNKDKEAGELSKSLLDINTEKENAAIVKENEVNGGGIILKGLSQKEKGNYP